MTTLTSAPIRTDFVTIRFDDALPPLTLPLSTTSSWSALLAGAPAPSDDALETIIRALANAHISCASVSGPACALALPILWLRSLTGAQIAVRASRSNACESFPHLAQLAIALADEADDDAVAHPADLLGAFFDAAATSADAVTRAGTALAALAARGRRRVAIYGAGSHTARIGPALMRAPVEILCVIDDNPDLQSRRLWGFSIVSLERAASLPIDAVLLSADSCEDALWSRAAPLRSRGVEVVRLYPSASR